MVPRRVFMGFLWRFALLYGVLIAPWPGFNENYGRCFRRVGEWVFAREEGLRLVHFEPVPAPLCRGLDTRILLARRDQLDAHGSGPVRYLELDTRGVGWVPTALIVALIIATPVPWRRRGGALVAGFLAVQAFVVFSVADYIWNHSAEMGLVVHGSAWKRVVAGLEETLITQMGASFVVPVLLWLLITLRRHDVAEWRKSAGK